MSICEIKGISKTYGSGATLVHAIRDIDLSIESREFTVFVGPSGSGKTTLLNQIGCLDTPSTGEVIIDGQPTHDLGDRALAKLRSEKIGFIFQSFNLIPVLTALENVELAMQLAGQTGGRARALEVLNEVGLQGLETRRPNQLSGGQQQRVAIARALVKRPSIVIADEPTANLDTANGEQVLDLMQRLNEMHGITFLFSTHDPKVMAHARRIIVLRDGVIVSDEHKNGAAS